jgi:RNA polymerase sigma-70 factor (ECF subfamily)
VEKEIFQEVLWKVWKSSDCPKMIDNPKGWIYTITVNTIKSNLRKRKFYPLKEDVLAAKDEIEEFIEKDSLNYMLQGLSEQEKYIVTQKAISKITFREIAQTMRKPIGSISSIYYRTVDKIKEKLEKNEKN